MFAVLVFLVCVGLGVGGAALYTSMQPKLYSAEAVIRVFDPTVITQSNGAARVDPTRLVALEVSYAQSDTVTHDAKKALNSEKINYDHVTWSDVTDQDAISVTCYAVRAASTVSCARQYAAVYVAQRKLNVPQSVSASVQSITAQIAGLKVKATELQTEISKTNAVTEPSKLKGLITQQAAILGEISDLTQQASISRAQGAALAATYQIVQPPTLPTEKVSPTPLKNYVVGLLAGGLLGAAILLLWQQTVSSRNAQRLAAREAEEMDLVPPRRRRAAVETRSSRNGHSPDETLDDDTVFAEEPADRES